MDEKIESTLKNFGLSENEIKIYTEAIKHKETSPYELSKLTKVPRTTIYDIIMSLSLKGLIELQQSDGLTKQQTKIKAKNPSVLRDLIRKKHDDLNRLEVDVVDILSLLKGDFHQNKSNANFKFLPGMKGAKEVYFSNLGEIELELPRSTFECFMPAEAIGKKEMDEEISEWIKNKENSNVSSKSIIPLNNWTKHVLTYQYAKNPEYIKNLEIRYIDSPVFSINQSISIIGSRIEIATVDGDEAWGLIVNSNSLSKTLLSIFYLIWSQASPISEGLIKSWGENQFLKWEQIKQL